MQRKLPRSIPCLIRHSFFHRDFSSEKSKPLKALHAVLCQPLKPDANVVIPVSMVRYDKDKGRFDTELSAFFRCIAEKIDQKEIKSVDVLSTTALHEDWHQDKITKIDNHFFDTHAKMPNSRMRFLRWNDWMSLERKQLHRKYYEEVLALSKEGSLWYNLMLETHKTVSISADLNVSLNYQRQEYAAIRTMSDYTDLIYMGHVSAAWAHLYRIDPEIPRFVRAFIQTQISPVKNYEADAAVKMASTLIEQIVSSPNFPIKQKENLQKICYTLFSTYIPPSPSLHSHLAREGMLSLTGDKGIIM